MRNALSSALTSLVFGAAATVSAMAQQAPAASFAGPPPTYDDVAYDAYVGNAVNVRVGGGTQFQRFDTLQRGEYIFVQGCDRSWCYIQYDRGVGYISKRYVETGANPFNPVNPRGPAGPGIPPQEPGTNLPEYGTM